MCVLVHIHASFFIILLFPIQILALRNILFKKYEKEHTCWQQFVLKKFVRKQAHFWYGKTHQQSVYKEHFLEENITQKSTFLNDKEPINNFF